MPPPLRITSLPDYPADAWGLDVSDWPLVRPSTLKAWWIEGSPLHCAQFVKGLDFQETPTQLGTRTRTWLSDPEVGAVTLESVGCKRWAIAVDGQRPREVSCLVVRLSYPPDKGPFFVRLRNNPERKIGVEDRFYTRAGKYTGVFWSVREEDLPNIKGLELFSVATLKEGALRVEELQLDPPNDRWKRPGAAGPSNE
jgi:hypothetical protein